MDKQTSVGYFYPGVWMDWVDGCGHNLMQFVLDQFAKLWLSNCTADRPHGSFDAMGSTKSTIFGQ